MDRWKLFICSQLSIYPVHDIIRKLAATFQLSAQGVSMLAVLSMNPGSHQDPRTHGSVVVYRDTLAHACEMRVHDWQKHFFEERTHSFLL